MSTEFRSYKGKATTKGVAVTVADVDAARKRLDVRKGKDLLASIVGTVTEHQQIVNEYAAAGILGVPPVDPRASTLPPVDPPPVDPPPVDPPPPTGSRNLAIQMGPGNLLTNPLAANAPLLPESVQQQYRADMGVWADRSSYGFEMGQWSARLFPFEDDNVYYSDGRLLGKGTLVHASGSGQAALDNMLWPVRPDMVSPGGEGHIALYNRKTGAYIEFIYATIGSTLSGGWGGGCVDIRKVKYMNETVNGSRPDYETRGSTALRNAIGALMILPHQMNAALDAARRGDWANADIGHPIAFEAYRHHPNQWSAPAGGTDWQGSGNMSPPDCPDGSHQKVSAWGQGGCPNQMGHGQGVIPMGGVRTLRGIDIPNYTLAGVGAEELLRIKVIGLTEQRYGAVMTDLTGGGMVYVCDRSMPGNPFPDMRLSGSPESTNDAPYLKQAFRDWLGKGNVVWVNTGPGQFGPAPGAGVYQPA